MKQISLSILVLLALASLVLGACGNAPAPQATVAPAADTAEPVQAITVTDASGRAVEFAEIPQRIVVAGKSSLTIVDTLFLFPEAAERVVGIVVGNQNPGDFLGMVDPTFGDKTVLEVEAGPEQIAPLKPDVVIVRSFMADKLGEPLKQVGIPVVYVDLETPEQYFRDLGTLGQLLGNEARAAEIGDFYRRRLDAIDAKVKDLNTDAKPRALLVQYSDKGGEVALNVPSASWIQTTEMELAGGEPVWREAAQSGGWTIVNFEQIAAWDPDKIFVISYGKDSTEIVAQLQADPRWQGLKAVQNGDIYGFPADYYSWDQPDPRWLLGVTWLATKNHPDLFADLDIEQEAAAFFEQLYGIDANTVQAQILSSLKGHVK